MRYFFFFWECELRAIVGFKRSIVIFCFEFLGFEEFKFEGISSGFLGVRF